MKFYVMSPISQNQITLLSTNHVTQIYPMGSLKKCMNIRILCTFYVNTKGEGILKKLSNLIKGKSKPKNRGAQALRALYHTH